MASPPLSSSKATPARPTYANAMARPLGSLAPSTPGPPSVAQLSPLHSTPSLCPKTTLQPLTIANWQPEWDDNNNNADGTEESKEDGADIGGTAETPQQQDDTLAVDINVAAAQATTAHAANNSTSIESGSPPLLSNPPFPGPPTGDAPTPQHCILLDDSSAAICYAAEAPWMLTPSIGALPTGDNDPMAKLNHAITVHLAELDRQQCMIGAKYNAFRMLDSFSEKLPNHGNRDSHVNTFPLL